MRLISASFATILLAPALALAAGSSSQLVWIDLNNDQLDDLLRYERGGTAQYLVNLGQGQFAEAPELASVQAGIEYAVAADLNSDQRAELILTTADGTAVLRYDSGTPELMTRIDATGPIEVRDADGDRRADLVIGDQIHRQNAQGELVPVALPEFESASSSTVTDVGIGESAPPSTDSWFKEFHKSNPLPDGVIYLENSSSGRTLLVENSSSGDAIEASASGTGTALRIQSPTSSPLPRRVRLQRRQRRAHREFTHGRHLGRHLVPNQRQHPDVRRERRKRGDRHHRSQLQARNRRRGRSRRSRRCRRIANLRLFQLR